MARPLRIQFENAYYHVTCRGNSRQDIYRTDGDRATFLDLLERSSEIYQTEILCYVLMENHFHLLVKTPLGNLQEFMRHFNISYTAYFNGRHRRTGHLYQGRYKSFLIQADHYLQGVSRYIHLNPIRIEQRAGMSPEENKEHLKDYRWSSYAGYVSGLGRRKFLRAGEVLGYFGGDTPQGREKYDAFVMEGVSGEPENPLEKGRGHGIIGGNEFIEKVKDRYIGFRMHSRELPAFKKILAQVEPERIMAVLCRECGVCREDLLRRRYRGIARGILMDLLYCYGGMNQREIGEWMGVDYSAVSVMRKRIRGQKEKDQNLCQQIEWIRKQLDESQE